MLIKKITNPLHLVDLPELPDDYLKADSTQQPIDESVTGKKLSECIKLYLDSRKLDEINEKTYQRYVARAGLMLRVLGDVYIKTLNREAALAFQKTILALPKNINKDARYREQSIEDILASNPEPMSSTTANDTFTDVNKFFDWCVTNDLADRNSFSSLKVKQRKRASEQRSTFSPEDLSILFSQDTYQYKRPKHPHYYWLPILALHTGARLNELCQLYKDDIQLQDGVWTVTFTDQREDQRLKNTSSHRTIPLHSRLIELGFIEYINSVRHERVFPELKHQRDGYQTAASKWFARYRNVVLPSASQENKTFHSFRHTVADNLKQKGLSKSPVSALLGHSEDSETFGRYGKAYVMEVLIPITEALSFDVEITPWQELQ